jgi:TolB-like protein
MKKLLLLSLLLFTTVACATGRQHEPTYEEAQNNKFIQANYAATDHLLASLTQPLDTRVPLVVATLVNIDELTESSRLGRAISEQIGARLITQGYPVVELKLRGNIFVKQSEGELLLSRELQDIALNHKAQAVMVGTYSVAKSFVYVNIKMVSMRNNVIIAAHDYVLPIDSNVRALLIASARK